MSTIYAGDDSQYDYDRNRFASQLKTLKNMGYTEERMNVEALRRGNGDVTRAMDLLSSNAIKLAPLSSPPSSQKSTPSRAPTATVPSEYIAAESKLRDMGFKDTGKNVQALKRTGGNVQRAVEDLLRDPTAIPPSSNTIPRVTKPLGPGNTSTLPRQDLIDFNTPNQGMSMQTSYAMSGISPGLTGMPATMGPSMSGMSGMPQSMGQMNQGMNQGMGQMNQGMNQGMGQMNQGMGQMGYNALPRTQPLQQPMQSQFQPQSIQSMQQQPMQQPMQSFQQPMQQPMQPSIQQPMFQQPVQSMQQPIQSFQQPIQSFQQPLQQIQYQQPMQQVQLQPVMQSAMMQSSTVPVMQQPVSVIQQPVVQPVIQQPIVQQPVMQQPVYLQPQVTGVVYQQPSTVYYPQGTLYQGNVFH